MEYLQEERAGPAEEGIELAAAPDVAGVEVMRVNAPTRTWRWYHETYTISTAVRPMRTEWTYRGRTYRTSAGIIGLMEPGEMHADLRSLDERQVLRVLFLAPALVDEAAREFGVSAVPVHWRAAQVRYPELLQQLFALHAAFEDDDATPLERESRFVDFLETLLELGERGPATVRDREPDVVRRARKVLDERWAETVRLDELAAATGVGRFSLLRAFRAAVGVPPHAYQIRVRVTRAMSLIRVGMPLVEVALATGFADQSHLARHFRRAIGVSPGRYRQAVR